MIDQNNILEFFIKSECEVLTEEEMNDPTIPTPKVTSAELYERYNEWVVLQGLEPGSPADEKANDAIEGIYLKPDTLAAKRLAVHGKKYPIFKETREYEKWKAKKAIDE